MYLDTYIINLIYGLSIRVYQKFELFVNVEMVIFLKPGLESAVSGLSRNLLQYNDVITSLFGSLKDKAVETT